MCCTRGANAMRAFAMTDSGQRRVSTRRRNLAEAATIQWCEAARREGERVCGGHRRIPIDPVKLIQWLTLMEIVVRAENSDSSELDENST